MDNRYYSPKGFSLSKGEEVKWHGKRSWKSVAGRLIGGILLLIFAVIMIPFALEGGAGSACFVLFWPGFIGLASIIQGIIAVLSSEYVITDKRVSSKFGLIRRHTNTATFDKITDTELNQGLLGRLFSYGNVKINTAGGGSSLFSGLGKSSFEINFLGVEDPKYILSMVRNIMEDKKSSEKIQERIERIEDKYLTGEITEQQFQQAKARLKRRQNQQKGVTPPPPQGYDQPPAQPMYSSQPQEPAPEEHPSPQENNEISSPHSSPEPKDQTENKQTCPNCGKRIAAHADFCLYCGEKLKQDYTEW